MTHLLLPLDFLPARHLLALIIVIAACPGVLAQQGLDLAGFKAALVERIASTGYRDTIFLRKGKGQSCGQASEDRARELAYVVRSWQNDGRFGPYGARIGFFQGYNVGIGSLHTYTVLEVYDASNAVVHTLQADNYLGPISVADHSAVNWSATNTRLLVDVRPTIWQQLSGSIQGPSEMMPGEAAAFTASITNPPSFVQFPLSVAWELDDRPMAAKDSRISTVLTLWAPAAGQHTLVAKISHINANNSQVEQLARVTHSFTVSDKAKLPKQLSGAWVGTWRNSRKQYGPWTISLVEKDGVVTGTDDGEKIVGGKRTGDTMTWTMKTSDGKRWWTETVQIQDAGNTLIANYTGHDDMGTYTGGGVLHLR